MKDQCPFFKKKCLGNQCVMWKDETCLVVSFMENFISQPPEEFERPEPLTHLGFESETRELEVPTEIKLATPEELAAKLIDFAKKEFPDEEDRIGIYTQQLQKMSFFIAYFQRFEKLNL